jgi:hypothetical protein
MGTAVVFGMLIATVVGLFIIPGLYAWTQRWSFGKKPKERRETPRSAVPEEPALAAKSTSAH